MSGLEIEFVRADSLQPLRARVTYAFEPDLRALEASLLDHGWLAPLVVRSDGTIIDGHSRWHIAQGHRRLRRKVPVTRVRCSDAGSLVMHIRLNRGRGQIAPRDLSSAIRYLLDSREYTCSQLEEDLAMTPDEFELLADGTVFKARGLGSHDYSKAWVPVDGADPADPQGIEIERPPTPDG